MQQQRWFASRVFVEGIPKEWHLKTIEDRFGKHGKVARVNLIKNQTGEPTGKGK